MSPCNTILQSTCRDKPWSLPTPAMCQAMEKTGGTHAHATITTVATNRSCATLPNYDEINHESPPHPLGSSCRSRFGFLLHTQQGLRRWLLLQQPRVLQGLIHRPAFRRQQHSGLLEQFNQPPREIIVSSRNSCGEARCCFGLRTSALTKACRSSGPVYMPAPSKADNSSSPSPVIIGVSSSRATSRIACFLRCSRMIFSSTVPEATSL